MWWKAALALVVSLALQVAVNYANDYSDGIRGTDDDRVGPMRLVGSGAATPRAVKTAAFLAFGVAAVAGLVLAATTAWWLVAVGVVCVLAAWFYTGGSKPYGYLGLGEVMVFVFFGLVAVIGTTYVQTESFELLALYGAVGIGALACAILVVNNLRDIPTDTVAGKRTLAVVLGDERTRYLYALLVGAAAVSVVAVAARRRGGACSAWSSWSGSCRALRTVLGGATGPALIPVLQLTGRRRADPGGSGRRTPLRDLGSPREHPREPCTRPRHRRARQPDGLVAPPAAAAANGTISGTVTAVGGTHTKLHTQAQVQVYQGGTWQDVENAYTGYLGTYTTQPLAPGTYRVEFSNMDYLTQVSAPVTVTSDAPATVDAVLDPGATIQGRFTVPVGGPAVDGFVRVYERSSTGHWLQVDHGLVDPNGTYYVGGLAGGAYKVGFSDFKNSYKPEFFDNVATLEQAVVLNLAAGAGATGIDVTLSTEQLPIPAPTPPPPPVASHVVVKGVPRIVGKPRVGERVRAKIGTVTPTSAKVRYVWLLDGRRIKKATGRSLRLKAPMAHHWVSVKVIATAPGLERWTNVSRVREVRPARNR